MLFSEIPGLEEEKKQLRQAVRQGNIAHAQLFLGKPGGGNLALALAYITYLNCENRGEEDACGTCPSCSKTGKLVHPDVQFIYPVSTTKKVPKDAISSAFSAEWREFITEHPFRVLTDWAYFIEADNKQCIIPVAESRSIISNLSLTSFEGAYKCVLIWLPELMHRTAANSLLKILEEPTDKTLFILVSNDREGNLTTILSRTQAVHIRPFNDDEVRHYLINKQQVPEDRARQIAHMAEGNIREALKLSSEVEDDNHRLFQDWMRYCYSRDFAQLVDEAEQFQKMSKESQKGLLQYGLNMLRETLIASNGASNIGRTGESDRAFVTNFSKVVDNEKTEKLSTLLNQTYYHIERNANPRIAFLDTSIQIALALRAR